MPVFDRATIAAALPDHDLGPVIGQGAFGVVLAARHRGLGRDHAVKVLVDSDGQGEQTFRREAEAAASLDHTHVVRIHDYKFHEGLGLIVMERLTGGSLRDRIGTGETTTAQACVVGLAAADALHAAHLKRHIHRDVKPTNMLFTDDKCLRVTDFGIAKWMDGAATVASRTVGTPGYMAPEQFSAGELRPASDVYALAIVLYELLAGSPPFSPAEPSLPTYMRLHLYADPPRPDGVPEPLVDVLMRALAKRAVDRHPSAREFAVDLAAAAARSLPTGWLLDAGMPLFVDEEVREAAQGRSSGRPPSDGATTWAPPTRPLVRPNTDQLRLVKDDPGTSTSTSTGTGTGSGSGSGSGSGDDPRDEDHESDAPSTARRARVDIPVLDDEQPRNSGVARTRARETIPGERLVLPVTVLFVLLLLAALGTVATIQDDFYVSEHDGRVTIFRGTDAEVLGVPLHVVEQSSSLQVADLPETTQAQLRDGAEMADLEAARAFVANLQPEP